MTEAPERGTRSRSPSRPWGKYAITLLLLVAVVVTGILAFHSRNEWWDKYLLYRKSTAETLRLKSQ